MLGSVSAQTDTIPPYADDEIIDNNTVKPGKQIKPNQKRPGATPTGLFVGSNLGLFFGRRLMVDIGPYVGYRIGKVLAIGGGIPYTFQYDLANRYAWHVYGGRVFARLRPFGSLRGFISTMYVHAEGEYLSAVVPRMSLRWSAPAVNVGLGFMSNFDKGFSFTTEILVNALYTYALNNTNIISPITPFFQYRIGFCYNF